MVCARAPVSRSCFRPGYYVHLFRLGSAEFHPVPAVPRLPAAHGGGRAGGLAPLHTQGSSLQGGKGQPHLQVQLLRMRQVLQLT